MPEGTRRTPTTVTLRYEHYSINNVDGYPIHTFYVKCSDYLDLPIDANVREPSKSSIPYKGMIWTLESKPKNFLLENSGITVVASEVDVTKSRKTVKFTFPPGSGIINGGHTQLAIIETKRSRDVSNALVKVEAIEHVFSEVDLATIASSRNTASNVKPYSIAEKRGLFFKLKQHMLPDFEKHIIWWENREVPNERGMPAPDLIALLNLFNVRKFQSNYASSLTDQPNKSATSKSAVFTDWQNAPQEFEHIYPLTNDIINLREHIQTTFNRGAPRGFTGLNVITRNDTLQPSIFLGTGIEFNLPIQFLMPLLASLRADVYYDETAGEVGWYEKPEDLFDRSKKKLITDLIATFKTHHNVINQVSKDPNLWRILYLDVDANVNKGAAWKRYNVT